jgi:nucleoside 2-deoxyribosyltransferase
MTDPTPNGSPVYLSGPMFSAADLWQQQEIATTIEGAGYETYLPQRDGIEVGSVMAMVNGMDGTVAAQLMQFVREIVFAMDVYQLLDRCQSVVFNMDGRVPDEGSVVETASAFAAGRPIVIFKTTPITMLGGADNPMIDGLAMTWQRVAQLSDLPAAVAAAVVATSAAGDGTFSPQPHVQAVIDLGKSVWSAMPQIRPIIQSGDIDKMLAEGAKLLKEWEPELAKAFPDAPQRQ